MDFPEANPLDPWILWFAHIGICIMSDNFPVNLKLFCPSGSPGDELRTIPDYIPFDEDLTPNLNKFEFP
jgi:hypothetical protein